MSLLGKTSTDDLWIIAAEDPSAEVFKELMARLTQSPDGGGAGFTEKLDFLLENLGESDEESGSRMDPEQAVFFLRLAALDVPDSATLRKGLSMAVKRLLPPYLNKTQFVRSLGVRDSAVPTTQVARRFDSLSLLKNGTVVYLASSNQWGNIATLNSLTASVGITVLPGGGSLSVPMNIVLDHAVFFSPGPEILKLADSVRKPAMTAGDYRTLARRKALQELADEKLRDIAKATMTPRIFSSEDFEKWWKAQAVAGVAGASRRSCEGRSLKEVGLLLDAELANPNTPKLDDSEVAKFAAFYSNLKPELCAREYKLLGETIAKTVQRARPEQLEDIFAGLEDTAPFWPADLSRLTPATLTVWGDLAAKYLPDLAAATRSIFPDEYLAAYAVNLPQRALTPFCEGIDQEILSDTFRTVRFAGGDFMLWLWKNRKKMPADLLTVVNIENVVRALNLDGLPKAWSAGQRDLRAHLMDKADFQQQMIDAAGGVASAVISSLQGANFFVAGERQSLLVKLSRLSSAIREHLESGAGEQMLASAKEQAAPSAQTVEPLFTSPASHRRLMKELDDIINIHQPENRESLKTARAHGDFRENSEFDAAKERRNYLSRRRNELERDILRVQAVPFRTVSVSDTAVIGCTVTLRFEDGSQELYQLLGAWDGNPERNWLSYKTRLGEAIYGHQAGSRLTVPGDRVCVLESVQPLTPAVLDELD